MTRVLPFPRVQRSSREAREALESRARDIETLPRDTVRAFPTVDGALCFAAYNHAGAVRLQVIAPQDLPTTEGMRVVEWMRQTVREWEAPKLVE